MRSKAKMVNFGIPYGISGFGLAQRLDISRKEGTQLINDYFKEFPDISNYIESTLDFARENGFVETLAGRRRYLRDINSRNWTTRGAAERNAINMPIQGTAADMIKLAMINVAREIRKRGLKTRLLLQVHDELVLEVPKNEQDDARELVVETMQTAMELDCPIKVEAGFGKNWLVAH
jgi:DNA polymerase-1